MTVKTIHVPMGDHVKTKLMDSRVSVPMDILVPLAMKVCCCS